MNKERFENDEKLNYIYNVLNKAKFRNYIYDYDEKVNYCDYIDEYECAIDDRDDKIVKLEQALDENKKLINAILNFSFFKEECPLNFGFETNSEEDKAQKTFYNDEYCEKNCNNNYKNCWLKYFKELQKAKEDVK